MLSGAIARILFGSWHELMFCVWGRIGQKVDTSDNAGQDMQLNIKTRS